MRLIYHHEHEGAWFSENGHQAYLRGEKPLFLWGFKNGLQNTDVHHVARHIHGKSYTRELVMFYREIEPVGTHPIARRP